MAAIWTARTHQGKTELINPVKPEDVLPYIKYRLQSPHHSVSITGGEPLLFTDFIRVLAQEIKPLNEPLFLETNGTLPKQLEKVIDIVDIISMDMKLPSDVQAEYWQEHEQFLRIAAQKDVYVKIVVSACAAADNAAGRTLRRTAAKNARLAGFGAADAEKRARNRTDASFAGFTLIIFLKQYNSLYLVRLSDNIERI